MPSGGAWKPRDLALKMRSARGGPAAWSSSLCRVRVTSLRRGLQPRPPVNDVRMYSVGLLDVSTLVLFSLLPPMPPTGAKNK